MARDDLDLRNETAKPDLLFNHDAEIGVLGCLLYDNTVHERLVGLESWHFKEPFHQALHHGIMERIRKGVLAEVVELAQHFASDKAATELGGLGYLAEMVEHAYLPTAVSHASIVKSLALRREIIACATDMIERAKAEQDGLPVLGDAEKAITDLARGLDPGEAHLVDARTSAETTLAEIEEESVSGRPKGYMTGLRCIDRRLRGLRPGHLVVMAGRPSMGKTALARQAAFGCASRNPHHQVGFFCLEMARRELDERTFAELTYRAGDGIAYQDMSGDKLTPMDRKRLRELVWQIPKNFILDDTAALTVEYVERRVWAMKRRGPVAAVFIDYLQIMERPDGKGRNDAAVIGQMTAALKRLARAAEVCVVLLSQINRGVESRDDKRPQLSDLRESGSIEQDANAVLFPFREVYYVERAEPKEGTAEHDKWETEVELLKRRMDVLCAKNRGGAVGTDHQEYFAEFDAITDVKEAR